MSKDQSLVERLRIKRAHLKCWRTEFCKETERPAEKLRFNADRGRGSQRSKRVEPSWRRGCIKEREKEARELFLGVEAISLLGVFVRRREVSERRGGGGWDTVSLGGRNTYFVN